MARTLCAVLVVVAFCSLTLEAQESATMRKPPTATAAAVVNLNTATVAQLESLPGIGKATAERIIEYRQKNNGFKKIEELMNVRGIGEKSFLQLKPLITVSASRAERASQP
jgi:comEA protein